MESVLEVRGEKARKPYRITSKGLGALKEYRTVKREGLESLEWMRTVWKDMHDSWQVGGELRTTKIAVVSDYGRTISQHFGRARYYVVLTLDGRPAVEVGHMNFGGQRHLGNHEHNHGSGPEAEHRHNMMIDPITDCEILVAGGMGAGAYEAIRSQGMQPIVTDIKLIDEAAKAFIDGRLVDHADRIHR